MAHPVHINMIALLAVAFGWCFATCEWFASREPINVKKHGHKIVSIFRLILDLKSIILRRIVECYNESTENIRVILKPQVSRFQTIFCIVFFDHYSLCRTTIC